MYDNNEAFKNLSKALENIVNPPYLKQLKFVSNPPWLKEMQLISETIKSCYAGNVIPNDLLSETLRVISIQVPRIKTEGIVKAMKPFYGTGAWLKSIDVSSVTASMSEALTTLSSAATVIADSQRSIQNISAGLSRSIPNLFIDCDFETVIRKSMERSITYNADCDEIQDSFEWDDIQFRDNEVEYQGVVVTKDDVSDFMNDDTACEHLNDDQKKKHSLINAIIGIIITIMTLLDIPGNWTIQEIAQFASEYQESHNEQYCVYKDFANVYLHPETTSEKVDCLSYGTILDAVEENEFWIKITIHSSEDGAELDGWVQKTKIAKYHSEKE